MKTVRKIYFNIAYLSAALFVAGCSNGNQNKAAATDNTQAELLAAEHESDSIQAEFEQTLDEIDNSMNRVFAAEHQVSIENTSLEHKAVKNKKALAISKADIMRNIQMAEAMLRENREKIDKLTSKIGKLRSENKHLNKRLEEALTRIKQYQDQLADLTQQLDNKNVEIANLNEKAEKLHLESIMHKEFADKFEADLNTAWYTKGTYKELKESGVISKKGGVLGLGRTEVLNERFPDKMFAKIDIRTTTSIPVNAKKAKLVTSHPDGSYEMKKEANGQIASLEIKNPDEFWKLSKHLVVEVK